jgi:Spy/CpxP family protein refolding chaperone
MVEHEVSFLTKFFTLTTTQVTAVTGFVTTEQTCLSANSTNLQTAREALVTAIKGANPTTISTAIANLGALQSAQETCRATAAASIYADLTSTQQAKLGSGLGPLMGGGGGHFGPHPGGPPPAY